MTFLPKIRFHHKEAVILHFHEERFIFAGFQREPTAFFFTNAAKKHSGSNSRDHIEGVKSNLGKIESFILAEYQKRNDTEIINGDWLDEVISAFYSDLAYEKCEDDEVYEGKVYIFRKDEKDFVRRIRIEPKCIVLESDDEKDNFYFLTQQKIWKFWDEINIVRSLSRTFRDQLIAIQSE